MLAHPQRPKTAHRRTHSVHFNLIPYLHTFYLSMQRMAPVHIYTQCDRLVRQVTVCLYWDGRHGWYRHISNTALWCKMREIFTVLRKWVATAYYLPDLHSPLNYVLYPCDLQAAIEPLIPIQPTVQPGSSWRDEQVKGAMRPARTSRKFSIRDQSVLLTWHSLQPVQ